MKTFAYLKAWVTQNMTTGETSEADDLKRYGIEGWELCAVAGNNDSRVLYFKREITNQRPVAP